MKLKKKLVPHKKVTLPCRCAFIDARLSCPVDVSLTNAFLQAVPFLIFLKSFEQPQTTEKIQCKKTSVQRVG
jgi:hypothetical protein